MKLYSFLTNYFKNRMLNLTCCSMLINKDLAKKAMQKAGVDALIAASIPNVYYLSDYMTFGTQLGCGYQTYAVLPLDGEPTIVAPLNEADLVIESGTWIKNVNYYGCLRVKTTNNPKASETTKKLIAASKSESAETSCDALVMAITSQGLATKKLALDYTGVPINRYENIRSNLPDAKISDGSELLQRIRSVKTPEEINRIQRATEITEKAMEDALEIIHPDIMEIDLAGMYNYSIAEDGGHVTHAYIGLGERSSYPNPEPTTLAAAKGDLVRLQLGSIIRNYNSNISRTAIIERTSSEVEKRWKSVIDAQTSAIESIEPGVKFSKLFEIAQNELTKSGLKECPTSLGHCIGIECNERPWIMEGEDTILQEGMVINVDIPFLDVGWGGMQLEDTVLVTKKGFKLLTNTERTLYLI